MKKIHKKIGAVALASMIVAGGFASSKVESHAWWWSKKPAVVVDKSDWDLKKLSENARIDADYLEDYLKYNANDIDIIAASDGEDAMKDYIKRKYPQNKELLSRVASSCFYGRDVVGIARAAKIGGDKMINVKFSDAHVLLSVK